MMRLKNFLEEDETGVAIVMDASTGYIEAMVSYPSYDDNLFTFSIPEETWEYWTGVREQRPAVFKGDTGAVSAGQRAESRSSRPLRSKRAPSRPIQNLPARSPRKTSGSRILKDGTAERSRAWTIRVRRSYSTTPCSSRTTSILHTSRCSSAKRSCLIISKASAWKKRYLFDLPLKEANAVNASSSMTLRLLADMGYGQGTVAGHAGTACGDVYRFCKRYGRYASTHTY